MYVQNVCKAQTWLGFIAGDAIWHACALFMHDTCEKHAMQMKDLHRTTYLLNCLVTTKEFWTAECKGVNGSVVVTEQNLRHPYSVDLH